MQETSKKGAAWGWEDAVRQRVVEGVQWYLQAICAEVPEYLACAGLSQSSPTGQLAASPPAPPICESLALRISSDERAARYIHFVLHHGIHQLQLSLCDLDDLLD